MNDGPFVCSQCGSTHALPTFGWDYPMPVLLVPSAEREKRVEWSPDACIIDGRDFFLRGCVEIPVHGQATPFMWGVWAQVQAEAFRAYRAQADKAAPFVGRLPCVPPIYEDSEPEVEVTPRPGGIRPAFKVIPADHPMAVHQRVGLTEEEVRAIAEKLLHDPKPRSRNGVFARLRGWIAKLKDI